MENQILSPGRYSSTLLMKRTILESSELVVNPMATVSTHRVYLQDKFILYIGSLTQYLSTKYKRTEYFAKVKLYHVY